MNLQSTLKPLLLTAMVSIISLSGQAQDETENIRRQRKFGVELSALGPTILTSVNFNYSITHNINLEAGGGLIGAYGGAKFFFGTKDKPWHFAPYIGAMYAYNYNLVILSSQETFSMLYVPVGVQYIAKKGFTIGAEAAYIYNADIATSIWGAARIGYHF